MSNQRGFTLTEVLIAVLVLAVGLLGLAGLQLAGMKSNHNAYLRSQATIVAYDLLDRMRADPARFNNVKLSLDATADSGNPQFEAWKRTVLSVALPPPKSEEGEPQPQGSVDCTSGNGCGNGNCEVVVRWDDSRGGSTGAEGGVRAAVNATYAGAYRVCSRLPASS